MTRVYHFDRSLSYNSGVCKTRTWLEMPNASLVCPALLDCWSAGSNMTHGQWFGIMTRSVWCLGYLGVGFWLLVVACCMLHVACLMLCGWRVRCVVLYFSTTYILCSCNTSTCTSVVCTPWGKWVVDHRCTSDGSSLWVWVWVWVRVRVAISKKQACCRMMGANLKENVQHTHFIWPCLL